MDNDGSENVSEPTGTETSEATGHSETIPGLMCKCGAHLDVTVVQGYGVVKPCVACVGELAAEMVGKMIEMAMADAMIKAVDGARAMDLSGSEAGHV